MGAGNRGCIKYIIWERVRILVVIQLVDVFGRSGYGG